MKKPLVSVVIPNYNHGKYLRERIDSVLAQSFQDFEVIVLDDKSTDNSLSIINEYKDNPHVAHIIVNEQNTGNPFIQWEHGISLAQGEYIWIAESDDVAEPQLLESLITPLQATPKAVVAFCHSQMIDSEGKPMQLTWHPHGSSGETIVYDSKRFIKKKMLAHDTIYNASMVVFKKSVFSLIPSDYKEFRYCGDWLFWTYVCMHGSVIEVCQQLNHFRQHDNKVTNRSLTNGGMWRDAAGISRIFITLFHLNTLQQRCIRGRCTKRFNKQKGEYSSAILSEFPDIYGGTTLDIVLYEIGKMLGFLKS